MMNDDISCILFGSDKRERIKCTYNVSYNVTSYQQHSNSHTSSVDKLLHVVKVYHKMKNTR